MIPIPSPLVEFILLGPMEDRRQLQDSPILGDVWVEFGKAPADPLDLLISPYRGLHPGAVAYEIDKALENKREAERSAKPDSKHPDEHDPQIAFLQGLVVASLTFAEVAQLVVPKTKWWTQRWCEAESA